MFRELVRSVSFVLVLGLTAGVAEAAFDTVGVYDPDDDPHHNQVDQSGVYNSHTGNAGPENVIDLATFQELIGPAFDADGGGVVDAERESGSRDGQDIIANFGVSRTKSVTFTETSGNLSYGSGGSDGGRLPTSGDGRFSKGDGFGPDFVFDISPVTGGVSGEVVTYVAGTLFYRNNRELNPQVTATFSGGGTVTATADMPMGDPDHSLDAFFGFVAPPGEGIVNVNFHLGGWTNLDDVAFITSAFVVALKEASDPSPADEATDVPRDVVLSWTPGQYAPPTNGHKVYLSDNFNDVNEGIGGVAQDANSYAPGRLDFGTTYYWRVDEVNGPPDYTVYEGDVWSFMTEPIGYPIPGERITATASSTHQADMGPENTINGTGLDANDLHSNEPTDMWLSGSDPSGAWIEYEFDKVYKLHEMWVWNSNQTIEPLVGFGLKDVTIEHSTNGTDYTTLGTTHEFAQAAGTAGYAHNTTVDFGGAAAKYVRLTADSNRGMLPQYGLSEVRFFHIPVRAREPSPQSGATDVAVDVTLGWRAGREAAQHEVYVSTEEQAVIDGTAPVTTVTEAKHGPLSLDLGTTYYWKINEVNEAETPTSWDSDVWNLTTPEFLVVDDFESYNDLDPGDPESNRIFNVWVDGWQVPTNGSLVGYENPPFCERTIVHGGEQSMPLFYNNTGGAAYSEAELPLSPPQDWTKAGIATLVLYFHGAEGNTGQLYVKVNGSKVVYGGDAADIAKPRWTQWNIDLASVGTNPQNVTRLSIGIDGGGATGTLYVDDIRLYRLAPEVVVSSEEIWVEAEAAATITAPMKIYDDPAASGGKYIGTDDGIGDESSSPPADGIATYTFTVAGGTYKISGRINIPGGSNSFWVRIQGATIPAETELHSSGWVRWNDMPDAVNWFWNDVFSDDDDQDATVLFTMPAGTYTLEIARGEDGAMLDVIVISKVD